MERIQATSFWARPADLHQCHSCLLAMEQVCDPSDDCTCQLPSFMPPGGNMYACNIAQFRLQEAQSLCIEHLCVAEYAQCPQAFKAFHKGILDVAPYKSLSHISPVQKY